jgi:hypothetical protein
MLPSSDSSDTWPKAARFLEGALLFTLIAHAAGMVSMAALLLRAMPGGTTADTAQRIAYIANHPWLWRFGWFPWQVTALSDLLVGIALIRTPWIPRTPAVVTTLLTIAAIVPDQGGQLLWTWHGTTLARRAIESGQFGDYLQFESHIFQYVAGWAPAGYLAGALGWTWCFATARIWSRGLTWLSIATWIIFGVATAFMFLPANVRERATVATLVSAGNAIAFVLLMIWLTWVTELAMRRSRPTCEHGCLATWRPSSRGLIARGCAMLANSRLARAIGERLPILAMASDIHDVVYINYLVEAERLAPLVQKPLELQRLGPDGRYAMFTLLTYRHGSFGPLLFGPLRRMWPSPVQSNWRIHVFDPQTSKRGIQFLTTAITSMPHALATRLLSEGVPMHVPAAAHVRRDLDGNIEVMIDPGNGSAPDVKAVCRFCEEPALVHPWNLCFENWRQMLAYCVPQDRALCAQPWHRRVVRQEIELGIPLEACQPLAAEVESSSARAIAGDAQPLCFLVEKVSFQFFGELYDARR